MLAISTKWLYKLSWCLLLGVSSVPVLAQTPITPDVTFGNNGSILTGLTSTSSTFQPTSSGSPQWFIMGQAVVNNDKILVCGAKARQWTLQQYLADGTLDTTFGVNGTATATFPAIYPSSTTTANGLVVQADGKIVVVGGIDGTIGPVWAAARYTAQGQLDPTFGTNGVAYPDPHNTSPSELSRVVVLADGRLLAAANYVRASPTRLFCLLPTGQPDKSFNNGSAFGPAINGMLQEMTTQPDGKVLLLTDGPASASQPGRVTRYTATGQLDPSFGTNGEAFVQATSLLAAAPTSPRPTYLHAIAVQADGKLVVAGHAVDGQVSGTTGDFPVLFRLNADGTLDAPFNAATKRSLVLTAGLLAVGIQSDGQIVVGGSANSFLKKGLLLARYSAAGVLDPTFGTTVPGVYIQPVPASDYNTLVRGLTILPATNRLLTWEGVQNSASMNMRLARYAPAVSTAIRPVANTLLNLSASPVPTTNLLQLHYTLPTATAVDVTLYNYAGHVAAHLLVAAQSAGLQEPTFHLQSLAPGPYFCTLQTATLRQTVKIIVAP
jgi:uncharacterized delta-60 repeat protein